MYPEVVYRECTGPFDNLYLFRFDAGRCQAWVYEFRDHELTLIREFKLKPYMVPDDFNDEFMRSKIREIEGI